MPDADLQGSAPDARDRQLGALAGMVQLERRVRTAATPEELGFLMVNDTHMIVPYRQAVFWRNDSEKVQTISGLAAPDPDAPFCQWLAKLFRTQLQTGEGAQAHILDARSLPAVNMPARRFFVMDDRQGGPEVR